jgi:surface antigen Omp85-like protein
MHACNEAECPVSEYGTAALMGRQRTIGLGRRGRPTAPLMALLGLLLASPVLAQEVVPQDAYQDPAVDALMTRARAARHEAAEGIESYEGRLSQRMYVGLTALRFRRERGLLEHERIANIRWSSDGSRVIEWIGMRTAIPIAGLDTGRPDDRAGVRLSYSDSVGSLTAGANEELAEDMASDLLDDTDMLGFDFDPGSERLKFGDDDWALHPLSDSAASHYRFSSGDTLSITLPANERSIVLYEVLVEPRRADFNLVAGSLWFDAESASLVRATYKPGRPFNLALDEPGDADDVPGFLQPIEADIDYITVEYSLQELRYWLPRRFAFQGEARLGSLMRIPITLEWNVGGYLVNEAESSLFIEGELPEGWQRQESVEETEDGVEIRTTVIVPTSAELREAPGLSESFGERSPLTFSASEIERLESELEGLLPTYRQYRPSFAFGFQKGMLRYNRVEGLSVGTTMTIPISTNVELEAMARVGNGDRALNTSGTLIIGRESGRWTLEAYHRLQSMADGHNPFGLTSSASNLLLGSDRGEYYRATGGAAGYRFLGERVRYEIEGFVEQQRSVELGTDFYLLDVARDKIVNDVLGAEDLDVYGSRGTLRWFSGVDPNGLIVTSQLAGEIASGDVSYQRLSGTMSASHPLPFGLAGALEAGGGTSWGTVPVQREYFLGGSKTLRGFHTNGSRGATFWRARGEVATGFAAARIGFFSDLGWVGDRADFTFSDPLASVGFGVSLLDGLLRADLARAIRGGSGWITHLYFDGLF